MSSPASSRPPRPWPSRPPPTPASPYATLPPSEARDLLTITHFILVHRAALNLTPGDLLSLETSLLARRGPPYASLLRHLPAAPGSLASLRAGVETLAAGGRLRSACVAAGVRACARPASVVDGRGVRYIWLRGDTCVGGRVLAGGTVLRDPLVVAEALRSRGGRKDVFVGGWIASRVECKEREEGRVRVEAERERVERERERERKERCGVTGGRRRRVVTYAESESEGETGDEDEEFVCEEVLDGGEGDEWEGGEGEEADDMVVGRVRVQAMQRARRAERRAGGKSVRRMLTADVEGECRRSKRLRAIRV